MEEIINANNNALDEYKGMLHRLIELGMDTSQKVTALDRKVNSMETRMDSFECNEEITYKQQSMLNSLIHKIVYMRLGINVKPSEWTDDERLTSAKYARLFSKRLRKEVANQGHLAFPFRTTKKGDYQAACEDIESWYPRYGVDALKKEADDNARARRIAREQGYE